MIIVSQNKEEIINFDNISNIYIIHNNEIRCTGTDGYEITTLGRYTTEERAKEVLNNIIIAYSDFEYYKNAPKEERKEISEAMRMRYEHFDTYEMPKE